jgi:hypothetical protein
MVIIKVWSFRITRSISSVYNGSSIFLQNVSTHLKKKKKKKKKKIKKIKKKKKNPTTTTTTKGRT